MNNATTEVSEYDAIANAVQPYLDGARGYRRGSLAGLAKPWQNRPILMLTRASRVTSVPCGKFLD